MTKPDPEPIDEHELPTLAQQTMARATFPMLATVDEDQPRLRPVSPVYVDEFTIYVGNLRSYHKTAEIAANPRVELCYLDEEHNQVRITGRAERVMDRDLLDEIWQNANLLRQYFESVRDPDLIIYRIVPARVRYMQEWALDYHEVPISSADR